MLESAIANAENNHDLDVDALVVAEAYVGKTLVMKRWHAAAPRPRRPDREAVLAPDDRRPRSRGGRALMGQKVNPIGLRLGINRTWDSPLVRRHRASTASCCTRTSRSASILMKDLKQAGGRQDRHRASAQEVPRDDPLGPSGRHHRQEGRRHREAAQEGRRR